MKKSIIFLIFLALPTLFCHAQENLSLEQCISLAKENNNSVKAADFGLQAAQYTKKSTLSLFFPSFTVSASAIYSTAEGAYSSGVGQLPVLDASGKPNGMSAYFPGIDLGLELGFLYTGSIKLEQPLYQGGKISAAYKISKLATEINSQNKRLTESEVILSTAKAYASAVKANELYEVAQAHYSLLTELMRTVEKAYKNGVKPQSDVLKVQMKLNESELNLRKTQNAQVLTSMNLCHYIGRPLTQKIQVSGNLPALQECSIADNDISSRPEYAMLSGKAQVAAQQVRVARSDLLPKLGLMGQFGYMNGIELNDSKLLHRWNTTVGLQLTIPIFDSMHSIYKLKSAKAQYSQALAQRDDTNEMLMLEMVQTRNNLDEAALECILAESSVKSAEENLRSSRLQYEKGTELLSDYLEAQTLWQQAHQTLIEADVNRYVTYLDYLRTTGKLN